jgi:hypothetical protein
MSRVERDPERGRAVAARLKALGVKGILIKAAEQGYTTKLECKMPKCFCPEELGGAGYFEPDTRGDWSPTHEHFPLPKKDGGHRKVDNAVLAHRLCNRIDHSIRVGRVHERDLERIGKARQEATRRNTERSPVVDSPAVETVRFEGQSAAVDAFLAALPDGVAVVEVAPTRRKARTASWRDLPAAGMGAHLLATPTIPDRVWTDEPRLPRETREAFVRRVLLGETAPVKDARP